MHLGLQTMAYRHYVPDKYSAEITDRYWDQLDGTLPDPNVFDDLPGGASGGDDVPRVTHAAAGTCVTGPGCVLLTGEGRRPQSAPRSLFF